MIRNLVILISTGAILLILFFGYSAVVRDPHAGESQRDDAIHSLPAAQDATASGSLKVGPVAVPPGGQIVFVAYDPNTGRPTDRIRCDDWSSVPGTKNEIAVTRPELTMLMPSGMIATVTGDRGQLTVDRVQKSQMRPKMGWLDGNAKIVIDRKTDLERTPADERPEDMITVAMDRLDFDLELGELQTDGPVRVSSADFEIAGAGLSLIWSQAENKVETLVLRRGEQLVFFGANGLFGSATPRAEATASSAPAVSEKTLAADKRAKRRGRATAYSCALTGGVCAEQWRGADRLGALKAEELRLLFDVGGTAGRLLDGEPRRQPATAPTSRPDRDAGERLVVTWSGPLTLGPSDLPIRPQKPRRRVEAVGGEVTLTHGDGLVRCGRLEYFDETQQVWLYPRDGGQVDFGMGEKFSAVANSIYIDRAGNLVKLIGDVTIASRNKSKLNQRPLAIRCSQWAELLIDSQRDSTSAARTAEDQAPSRTALALGGIRAAKFAGDVVVQLDEQRLTAHRVDTTFRKPSGDEQFDALLTHAVATGGARLTARDESLECGELRLAFANSPAGELYPSEMDARGAVVIKQDRSEIRGARVRADLAPPLPAEPGSKRTAFVVQVLTINGRAELSDPDNHLAARGDEIVAHFAALNDLNRAIVRGTPESPGLVRAAAYRVRGERIELDRLAETLHVDGRSELRLRTERGLQGERRSRPTPIVVTSRDSLHVDGKQNSVNFVGQVVAKSEQQQLRADTLSLTLEEVRPPAPPQPSADSVALAQWTTLAQMAWQAATGEAGAPRKRSVAVTTGFEAGRGRKEPIRLVAKNAVIESESIVPGEELPLVHSSISAAQFDVDVVRRIIRTGGGQTTLLLTNRRLADDTTGESDALGVPSAMITRGPSQTAMQCDGSMTYAIGGGPDKQDTVLFDGGVVFVHRAGRDMVNIEQMLPQLAGDKEAIARLKARNTYMESRRLECGFASAGDSPGAKVGGIAPLRMNWLMASDNVYLRDMQGAGVRTVHADMIEFDRANGLVRVTGSPQANARVYYENPETNRFDAPTNGPKFIIDLKNNTLRSAEIEGEFRSPK